MCSIKYLDIIRAILLHRFTSSLRFLPSFYMYQPSFNHHQPIIAMRVLYLALMATATVQVQSPASGLATPSVDTAQTATSILTPVLTGKPSTDAATRFLRTHP